MLQPILSSLNSQRIVLASGSPRRKTILQNIGLKFEIVPSTFEENIDKSSVKDPDDYVLQTAKQKALEVASRLQSQQMMPDLLISADTVVTQDNKIFEKPKSKEDAFRMLMNFSGRNHVVCTGVVLASPVTSTLFTGDSLSEDGTLHITQFNEHTEVTMTKLIPEIVHAYIETGEPMDKAGGYGIQAAGGTLIEGIKGDYFNVMGFPLHRFSKEVNRLFKK